MDSNLMRDNNLSFLFRTAMLAEKKLREKEMEMEKMREHAERALQAKEAEIQVILIQFWA